MNRFGVIFIVALVGGMFVVPAQGEVPQPSELEIQTLTPIDSLPTKEELVTNVTGPDQVGRLEELALNPTVDFGIQLRAIRAIPHFCGTPCSGSARTALLNLLSRISPTDHSGQTILRLRAVIEALGIARSGDPADVDLLVPYLDNASRDIRAAAARGLRDMCQSTAIVPLRARYQHEQVDQVRLAISAALRDLDQCSQ
ncbi:MAG: hypothetical protein H6Q90_4514 [Deltaproteobacteria bacterium]|nr:hypothetical protein [Deltaproteobacteria bacterium]